jgi:hypothetical protein
LPGALVSLRFHARYNLASTYDKDNAERSSASREAREEIVVLSLLCNIGFRDVLDAGTPASCRHAGAAETSALQNAGHDG